MAGTMREYGTMLTEIKGRVRAAQYSALRAVNKELIALYWDIGRIIEERQSGNTWGKSVVERLAMDLQAEFPGVSGFSRDNIWRMRKFYLHYSGNSKLAPLAQEISWTKNICILESCGSDIEREFYLRMTQKHGWSKATLANNIAARLHLTYLQNQTNFERSLPVPEATRARLAVKDEYNFDFLGLGEEHSEKELETALIGRVNRFLAEMGGVFAFIGSQYRLEMEGEEYFIDILLYHRHLKCLVAIELKTGKFLPEHVGKMQFYLSLLDDKVRTANENPSVGIILCRDKNRTIVEYALRQSRKPIGVAAYKIVQSLPKELKAQLPTPEQARLLLEGL
ncbi:MAG: hypothetical protein A2049_03475 [Elusimicrobia bacterium GWA2_62_23]|nr:MAG: hypothetical protein A2049_03475 [Elusimicrobia bacterium GWA2_62_23]OGR68201.1 MAG: hypothetical protein A2179_01700 [Elusimicrobia bacterium GWC2_63_65]